SFGLAHRAGVARRGGGGGRLRPGRSGRRGPGRGRRLRRRRKEQAVGRQHQERQRDGEEQTAFIHLQGILAAEKSGYGIDAPASEWLAAQEPPQRKPRPAKRAVAADRFLRVDAAARPE